MSASEITDVQIKEALDRIAMTNDGKLLYLYCQQERMRITPPSIDERALPRFEGRRSFAADLMALMGEGIAASGGSAGNTPIVLAKREPARVSGKQSAREWLAAQPANPEQPWSAAEHSDSKA
jgi:hypothetical protein